jgi:uncharacterized protein (TIRG00374 family)
MAGRWSVSRTTGPPSSRPDESRPQRLGDRLERAIEHHADVAGELRRGEDQLDREPPDRRGRVLRRRAFWLAACGVSLYLVAPSVVAVLGSWRRISEVGAGWLALMAILQAAALGSLWALQHVALGGVGWRPVIASQLAGNALSKVAPGGGAMGGALQYRMLVSSGASPGRTVGGLTGASLLTFAVILALPVFGIPAIVRGDVEPNLLNATIVALVVFALLFGACALLLVRDRAVLWLGRALQRTRNRLRPRVRPLERLPQRLLAERDRIVGTLGARWRSALLAAFSRWGFDFGCLVVALHAVDALPRPGLVLLAFCAAQVLAQIPVTPGGLGFVEAGLSATLTLAGVPPGEAVLATFAYRLMSYWLHLPLGLVGLALARVGSTG